MSAVTHLLARLASVRETSPGRWSARCPAHADRSPSLGVRELPDGRVLVHCFAGCETAGVLAAVGLGLRDLYPEQLPEGKREGQARRRGRIYRSDVFKVLAREAAVVAIAASDMASGKSLSNADADRCARAAGRINRALEVVS